MQTNWIQTYQQTDVFGVFLFIWPVGGHLIFIKAIRWLIDWIVQNLEVLSRMGTSGNMNPCEKFILFWTFPHHTLTHNKNNRIQWVLRVKRQNLSLRTLFFFYDRFLNTLEKIVLVLEFWNNRFKYMRTYWRQTRIIFFSSRIRPFHLSFS